MAGVLVVGTDAGVGTTTAAAALVRGRDHAVLATPRALRHRAAVLAAVPAEGDVVVDAGPGLLVPLADDGTTPADVAADLDLPVVLACGARRDGAGAAAAGHVRLTAEALWARGLVLHGVVVVARPGARPPAALCEAVATTAPLLATLAPDDDGRIPW